MHAPFLSAYLRTMHTASARAAARMEEDQMMAEVAPHGPIHCSGRLAEHDLIKLFDHLRAEHEHTDGRQ